MNNEILSILKETGAFLEGHFELSSKLHSPNYVQCALVLQYPEFAEKIARLLAEPFENKKVKVVIAPALGGIIICHEVARVLGARAIFAERLSSGEMTLRRGFEIESGENVLVVEDVVTTGRSTKVIIGLVEKAGGAILGCGFIVDRSSGKVSFHQDTKALLTLEMKTYNPDDCPLCREGIPLVKPGSRGRLKGG